VAVLAVGFSFEGLSLRTARREGRADKRDDEGWLGFVPRTPVPELTVVILEDSGALVGLLLAFVGTTLAEITGEPRFDAIGSMAIGVLLALIAWTLASNMKSTLIGEAADPEDVRLIRRSIEADPAVAALSDLRTELLGPDVRAAVPSAHLVYLQLSSASGHLANRSRDGSRRELRSADDGH
jgi:Co/Zn/Cd efflux system component